MKHKSELVLFLGFLAAIVIIFWSSTACAATFTLSWTDNSDNEDGFRVERKLGQQGTYAEVGTTAPNINTLVDVTPDQQLYCYRVKSFNAVGDSPPSNEACATAVVPPLSPSTITITITSP